MREAPRPRDAAGRRLAKAWRGAPALREAWTSGALALLWIGAWGLGRIQEYAPHASLWFPPAGLTFAAFAVLGVRAVPGIATASVLVTLRLGDVYGASYPLGPLLLSGVLFAAAHVASYGLGAAALRRWAGTAVPRVVTAFLAVAPLSAAAAAATGAAALSAGGLLPAAEARAILLPWFVGDFVGVVALAPAFAVLLDRLAAAGGVPTSGLVSVAARLGPAKAGRRSLAVLFLLCLVPLGGSFVLLVGFDQRTLEAAFLVFFSIVPLMWIVHTEGALRTFASVAALSVAIAGAGAAAGAGPHTTAYQYAMIVLAGSAYFGLAVPSLYLDNEHLRRLATTDALTGAANRLAFDEAARRETERARRFGTPLSVVLLDLDHFKEVNDSHGHAFGDAVLAEVAARLRGGLRDSDVLGRVGGEEFALLLPMTDAPAALETAERLRRALRAEAVVHGGSAAVVTASFGVAPVDPASGFEAAREAADRALYEAKRRGRDRVEPAAPA